nr:type II toxin-antitoxin system VapC family toxin [Acidiphilium sp.]
MKLLLDTHVLLWAAGTPRRLPRAARALLEDEANELVFSAASLWEVAIKQQLGREDFRADARLLRRGLLDNSITGMPSSPSPVRMPSHSTSCRRCTRTHSTAC